MEAQLWKYVFIYLCPLKPFISWIVVTFYICFCIHTHATDLRTVCSCYNCTNAAFGNIVAYTKEQKLAWKRTFLMLSLSIFLRRKFSPNACNSNLCYFHSRHVFVSLNSTNIAFELSWDVFACSVYRERERRRRELGGSHSWSIEMWIIHTKHTDDVCSKLSKQWKDWVRSKATKKINQNKVHLTQIETMRYIFWPLTDWMKEGFFVTCSNHWREKRKEEEREGRIFSFKTLRDLVIMASSSMSFSSLMQSIFQAILLALITLPALSKEGILRQFY